MAKKRDIEGNRLHRFELSGNHRTVRWVLIGILLVVGAVALSTGLLKALEAPAGWQKVGGPSAGLNCSHEFTLMYDLGAGEHSATEESKALRQLYGKATENAWKLFYNEAGETDLTGLYALNKQPNVKLQLDEHLYTALAQMQENGSRALYLAPVYAAYDRVFYSDDAHDALENDPTTDEYTRGYVEKLVAFANDPESIQLELHSDNRVTLYVSETYLAFAKENEIGSFLDFGWLRNAFIIDYMAQILVDNGFTNGYFSSVDGFVRNLDQRSTAYTFNLFDRGEAVAVMEYHGAASIAFLRSYPVYEEDYGRYYTFADGRTVTALIDPDDGQSKTAADQLVSYSKEMGCAELALSMLPVYVTEEFSEDQLNGLTQKAVYSVWFADLQLRYNQPDLPITLQDAAYTTQFAK